MSLKNNAENQNQQKNIELTIVERIVAGVNNEPREIRVRFKQIWNVPSVQLNFQYKSGIREFLVTPTNEKLSNAIISALTDDMEAIREIKDQEQALGGTENFELELFEQFLSERKNRLTIEDDFKANDGTRYLHAKFTVAYHRVVEFYLLRTEHLESLLDAAKAA
ncbi:MAG: hypothetical protein GX416_10495 [Bacteroidales bacterium]|nr:hypothetical protein [Bacteroidales bacterium]